MDIFYIEKNGNTYFFTARIDKYLFDFEKKTGCKVEPTGLVADKFGLCWFEDRKLYTRKELENILK